MRILLGAHLSGRTVGKALVEGGHDVRALDSEIGLEGLSDPEVLELAAAEGRVLVTANIRDFEPLLREWAGESRSHAGVILVPSSVRNESFGILISGVQKTIAGTAQEEWINHVGVAPESLTGRENCPRIFFISLMTGYGNLRFAAPRAVYRPDRESVPAEADLRNGVVCE